MLAARWWSQRVRGLSRGRRLARRGVTHVSWCVWRGSRVGREWPPQGRLSHAILHPVRFTSTKQDSRSAIAVDISSLNATASAAVIDRARDTQGSLAKPSKRRSVARVRSTGCAFRSRRANAGKHRF